MAINEFTQMIEDDHECKFLGDYILKVAWKSINGKYYETENVIINVTFSYRPGENKAITWDCSREQLEEFEYVLGYMNIQDVYDDKLFCFNDEKYKFEEG